MRPPRPRRTRRKSCAALARDTRVPHRSRAARLRPPTMERPAGTRNRRTNLAALFLVVLAATGCGAGIAERKTATATPATSSPLAPHQVAFLDTLEEHTFRWFWDTTPANGLTPDRWPAKTFSSIAAVGFALTAYPIGIEHGWITREQGLDRTLATLRYLWASRQDSSLHDATGYRG